MSQHSPINFGSNHSPNALISDTTLPTDKITAELHNYHVFEWRKMARSNTALRSLTTTAATDMAPPPPRTSKRIMDISRLLTTEPEDQTKTSPGKGRVRVEDTGSVIQVHENCETYGVLSTRAVQIRRELAGDYVQQKR